MVAFEITPEDVGTVMEAHGLDWDDQRAARLCDELDHEAIIDWALAYVEMGDQVMSVLSDIENTLIEAGVISGDKEFYAP